MTNYEDHALHLRDGNRVPWCAQCQGSVVIAAGLAEIVIPPADPDRDARVAARRAADARRAGQALDRILSEAGSAVYRAGYSNGWEDGYRASQHLNQE